MNRFAGIISITLLLIAAASLSLAESINTPRYLATGLFIASIEEGARIFTPVRFLPFDHPESMGNQFPTVLQFHKGEDQILLLIGELAGYKLRATLRRYPCHPDTLWPYDTLSRLLSR